jgi:NTP pyrophosphatase (non-canonical NTP hydrolase)
MRMHDLTNIANHYGLKHQLVKCKEELGELIEAIDSTNDEAIIEEIADVEIMTEQLKQLMCADRVVELYKDYKIARQLRRIAEEPSLQNPKNCKELYEAGKDFSAGFRQGVFETMKEQSHEHDN